MLQSFSLSAYCPVVGLCGGSLLLEEEASLSDDVIRSHFSVTFLGQHLSVCFSSRPMVCAVSGSGLLSQGQMWVSFHGAGLNSRETVVTPATLGTSLRVLRSRLSPGAYANQATFCTSLRVTHGSSLGSLCCFPLAWALCPAWLSKIHHTRSPQQLNHSCS